MNFELSEQQKLLQESIFNSIRQIKNELPFPEKWKLAASTGITGVCIDKEYGGAGLGALDMLLALESMAKANTDNGLTFAIGAHTLSCVIPINIYGTADEKKKFL